MKNRILYGWSPRRALYSLGGIAIIVYAIIAKEWLGALLGGYFAAMGVFNFGCASGNCGYVRDRHRKIYTRKDAATGLEEINFEEIKPE
jgi:hypothetical protein